MGKKEFKDKSKKDSQLVIRLDKSDRDAFSKLCKKMDTSASREIRHFIRDFLEKHGD